MDGLQVFLLVLLGAFSSSHVRIDGSVLEMTVRPGDSIKLPCDCKYSKGVYILWYRNCSHENQPSLLLPTKYRPQSKIEYTDNLRPFPHFHLMKNNISETYDLLITNISDSEEGLYYCGTEELKVEDKKTITPEAVYRFSKVTTRILLNSSEPAEDCGQCWMLLISLCPASAVLSAVLSSVLMYYCQKTATKPQEDETDPNNTDQRGGNQDEDVCYAALEIRSTSQRPKTKKKTQTSDFSTYAAINTSRV